jgi:hypothetical protein
MAAVHARTGLRFAAELRGEVVDDELADALAGAGLVAAEIGIQSLTPEALRCAGRSGDAEAALAGARALKARGVEVTVDMIIGLPGDTATGVLGTARRLAEEGFASSVQIFYLLGLPGTRLVREAEALGLVFDDLPPYAVRRTPTLDESEMGELAAVCEALLDAAVVEDGRPLYATGEGGHPPRAEQVALGEREPGPAQGGAANYALWAEAEDPAAHQRELIRRLEARLRIDPHAVLDLVLLPGRAFDPTLLDHLRGAMAAAPTTYLERSRPTDGRSRQRRISVVIDRQAESRFPNPWLEQAGRKAEVVRRRTAGDLGGIGPGERLLVVGEEVSLPELRRAAQRCDLPLGRVHLAEAALEVEWVREVLGYTDSGGGL